MQTTVIPQYFTKPAPVGGVDIKHSVTAAPSNTPMTRSQSNPQYLRWAVAFVVGICVLLLFYGGLPYNLVDMRTVAVPGRPLVSHGHRSSSDQAVHFWFFAVDSKGSVALQIYAKQAVLSALHHTNLVPIVMLDGANPELETWFHRHNVTVIDPTKTDVVRYMSKHPEYLTELGMSTWYRIGIPELIRKLDLPALPHVARAVAQGKSFDYVLYTDADILFVNPVVITYAMLPRYVAMSVQGDYWCCSRNEYAKKIHTNAGVLVMNTTAMEETKQEFVRYIETKLKDNAHRKASFNDQTAFHQFFPVKLDLSVWEQMYLYVRHRSYFASQQAKYSARALPKIYEWEPYLGANEQAAIVHWHGKKIALQSCDDVRDMKALVMQPNNCILRALFAYNMTAHPLRPLRLGSGGASGGGSGSGSGSVSSRRSRDAAVYPPRYDWTMTLTQTEMHELQQHSQQHSVCHYTVTNVLTEQRALQGYQYYAALFFDYVDLICAR